MIIISVSIVGNKRLLHKGTREVHYTPKEPIQLFIAKNGFGKSTLLRELSPLPADLSGDYVKGGYKEIILQDKGHTYKLRSENISGKKHYFFIDDGDNLNTGHTVNVQKQLVEEHLGYTDVIHNLVMGDMLFTGMTPKVRREVLIKLCDVDVTYALEIHRKLTTELRNVQGAFKINQDRLYEVSNSLPKEDEINALQDDLDALHKDIRMLLELKSPNVQFGDRDKERFDAVIARMESLGREIIGTQHILPTTVNSLQAYHDHNQLISLQVRETEVHLDGLKREYESLNDTLRLFREDEQYTLDDIHAKIARIDADIASIKSEVPEVILRREDASEVLSDVYSLYETMDAYLSSLPTNENMSVYNKETIPAAREKRELHQRYLDKALNLIGNKTKRLEHMKEAKEQECPKCQYIWIPGYSDIEAEKLTSEIAELEAKVIRIEKVIKEVDHFLEDADTWFNHYKRFQEWVRQYPRLQYFWDYFVEEYRLFNSPRMLVGWMQLHIPPLQKTIEYHKLLAERVTIQSLLEQKLALEGKNKTTLCAKLEEIEERIATSTSQLTEYQTTLMTHTRRLDSLRRTLAMRDALNDVMVEVKSLSSDFYEYSKNRYFDELIDELQQKASMVNKRLTDAKTAIEVYKHLERSQDELSVTSSDYLALTEALSPINGIIAESLAGFINSFVGQMNHIIEQVWTSPLYVLPCSYEGGSLDYKFPLQADGKSEPTSDVSSGSKGEKELIDFVFMLIARRYLKIEHLPLFMDEVGSSFYEDNRVKLYNYLKLITDLGRIKQAFVVSHIANSHAVLHRVDINVIDPTGVLVTENTNKHFRVI